MSTLSAVPIHAVTGDEPRPRRWTRGEFDRMLDSDIFPAIETVVLTDGTVYRHGAEHPRPWTQEEYHCLSDMGILSRDERVELLEGDVVEKMTNNPAHATCVGKTVDSLREAFRAGFIVREQAPLGVSINSEPEPDVMVVPGLRDDYVDHHPVPADAVLVVEVSDSSLRTDQGRKMRLYAMAGCREYWILNLRQRILEVHRDPAADGYETKRSCLESETVTPLAAPGASVRVSDLLPLVRMDSAGGG